MTDREIIEKYIPLTKFIASVLGPRCEVVLHDLEDVDHSIVAIENGHISGRKIGDGLMDFALDRTFSQEALAEPFVSNLDGSRTRDGRLLLFSTYYIRNEENELIGFLGVNHDITEIVQFKSYLDSELSRAFWLESEHLTDSGLDANKVRSAHDRADYALCNAIRELHLDEKSISSFTKNDRVRIISFLNQGNLFELKGMVRIIAQRLEVSEPTVYRLLREVRETE